VPKYQKKKIKSVKEYVDFIDFILKERKRAGKSGNKSDFLFRGQRQDEPLLPKLERKRLKPKGKPSEIEKIVFDEFRRTSLPLLERHIENDWDLIAVAQHYGLPTRLLDWTFNALAALWFAVRNPPCKDENGEMKQGVVWMFKTKKSDLLKKKDYDAKKGPFSDKGGTRIFRPKHVSRNIVSQGSVFTLHRPTKKGHWVKFENNTHYSNRLTKILIPPERFKTMRDDLHILGVNHSTMFPDLTGLCNHLKWRYFYPENDKEKAKKGKRRRKGKK
jgi:hypothetical protein